MDKNTLNVIRIVATTALTLGVGLAKVVKDKQHPAAFGLTAAAVLTDLGTVVKKYLDDKTEPQDAQE